MVKQSKLKWGIISTGIIANHMAEAINEVPGSEIWGVASRNLSTARDFARKYQIENIFSPYSELISHPDVDIIYIGTPHPFHYELILECLNNGKHVLCEKPFTLNAKETQECIDLARKKKLFLMEAVWTRFFPVYTEVKKIVRNGTLGKIHQITGDFLVERAYEPGHRLFNLELGGGALLDIGVYLLSTAQFFFGKPDFVYGKAKFCDAGTDLLDNLILHYKRDVYASLVCGFTGHEPQEFTISGTDGYCKISHPFYHPSSFAIGSLDGETRYQYPVKGNGYVYMIEAVQEYVLKGETENAVMPLEETLFQMETMDELRKQWGLVYPGEKR